MSSVYFYTYTAMQIPSGLLFDRYDPKIIITLSILVCTAGVVFFAFAKNIYFGAIARLLMGTGSAFAFVAVLVVTADLFEAKYFALMTGVTQMLAALGAMAGQMPVSALVLSVGWRHTLFILAALGIALAFLVWKTLDYGKSSPLTQHSQKSMNVLAGIKKIIRNPQTPYVALYACLLWAPMSSFASLWGVPFLMNADHLGQNSAAFLCSLMWLGLALASPLLGWLSTVFENKVLFLVISALAGVISFGLILKLNLSVFMLGGLLFLAGAACSGQALSFAVVKENNEYSLRATAIAFNNMAVVISGALFQPLIGKLIEPASLGILDISRGLWVVFGAYVGAFLLALFFIKEPV
jgi:MFS family permease